MDKVAAIANLEHTSTVHELRHTQSGVRTHRLAAQRPTPQGSKVGVYAGSLADV